ncbi:unnamed protein product [Rotaria magnacalcarata]|uniref:SWIM-type domain-containing protein n=3 Tax=Rotaria magnacalcarata TaxID=392030 RepID=A0A816VC06_9BILA|nr:unnamed protein product [Rotaria magnacalcarata]
MSSEARLQNSAIHENIDQLSSSSDDKQEALSSCSQHQDSIKKDILSNDRKIIFDKALGKMLIRSFYLIQHEFPSSDRFEVMNHRVRVKPLERITSFYLIQHEFPSSDRFEGLIYTYNRHRYKIIISYESSCSCKTFRKNNVCKHFLFVLKRIFNVDIHSLDIRLAIIEHHQFTNADLEYIFQGQVRRLCSVASPLLQLDTKENLVLSFKRQSIDFEDVCPICFERLIIKDKKLITCFYSCGKSLHKNCMNNWKHIKGKATNCPYCQVHWIDPSAAQKTVLDYYAKRAHPIEKREKYFLCCLYTPPDGS